MSPEGGEEEEDEVKPTSAAGKKTDTNLDFLCVCKTNEDARS